jgi:phage gp36-like protein
MGDFISRADVEEYLSDDVMRDLTDDDASGLEDTDPITLCIAGGEAEVLGYVTKRYGASFPSSLYSDPGLEERAVILTALRLYSRRRSVPQHMKDEAETAREWLAEFAAGNVDPVEEAEESDAKSAEFSFETRQFSRTLGRKGWESW